MNAEIRLIFPDAYREMPWKNGGGTTREILISPENGTLEDFDWRLSSARIEASGPFSPFPGCDRLLVVLEGDGIELEDERLLPRKPYFFHGDEPREARLIGGAVTDLGLIYRRDRLNGVMNVWLGSGEEEVLVLGHGTHLIYNAGEGAKLEGLEFPPGTTAMTQAASLRFESLAEASGLLVVMQLLERRGEN